MFRIALQYFWYRIFSPHRKGFGIHSPFVFQLVNEVLLKKDDAGLTLIKAWRKSLAQGNETIKTLDFGAGSKVHSKNHRKLRKIIHCSSISHKNGRVLYYLCRMFNPETVIELGTGLGISTAYLSKADPGVRIISVEADKEKAVFAEYALKLLQITQAEILIGSFDSILLSNLKSIAHPLMVFIDGDHSYESTMRYFNRILEYKTAGTIIVIDDIRWSRGMEQAWNDIKENSQTVLTIDLFFIGIVFFRKGHMKQNFKINF